MYWKQEVLLVAIFLLGQQCTNAFSLSSTTTTITNSRHVSSSTARNVASVESENDISSNPITPPSPDMKAYASGYTTVFQEVPYKSCEPSPSSGTLPPDLIGTYFRSGPAMFSAGSIVPPKKSIVQPKQPPVKDGVDEDRMVKHPFDGDGAILGVTLNGNGKATARYRFVRTAAMTNERKKGMKLYSGMESTRAETSKAGGNDFPVPIFKHHLKPGLNKKRKNTSNTRAIYWSKKLLTLWEGGLPYKLDALGLSTEGRSQLGGVLKEADPFSGKAVYDPIKQRMLFYSNRADSGSSELTLWEFNAKFRVASNVEYKIPGFALFSDFAATEKYAVFVQPPVSTNGMQFMMGKEPGKSLKIEQGAATMHLLRRGSPEMKSISIPYDGASDADLHFCNAYEEDGGKTIILDVIRSDSQNLSSSPSKSATSWPWASSLKEFEETASRKSLWRYTVNVGSGSVSKECLADKDLQTYYGVINPSKSAQKHTYIYSAVGAVLDGSATAPPQGIAKIDVETKEADVWYPKEYEFCGEPMYAERKNADTEESKEDDGYILSVLYNGEKKESELIVLEASDIKKGPISRVPLGVAIPHGLHGCFASGDECNWEADEIERRAKLSDKMESRGNMWNEVKSDFSGLGLRLDDFEEIFGDIL